MEKTSKIKSVTFKNEWNNPKGGVLYYHEIELENGDKGQIGTKKPNPFAIGDDLTYTIEQTEKGNKIKRVLGGFTGNNYGPRSKNDNTGMMVGNAITNAVNLVCNGKVEIKDIEATAKRICQISIKLKSEIDSQS